MKILMWATQKARDSKWIDNLCVYPKPLFPFSPPAVQIDTGHNQIRPLNLYFLLLTFTTRSNFYLFISYKPKHPKSSRVEQRTQDQTGGSDCDCVCLACKGLCLSRIHQSICLVFAYHLGRQVNKRRSAKHRTIANWLTICTVGTFQCQVDNNCWKSTKNVTRTLGIHSQ